MNAISDILPSGVGVALSPIPIVAVILMLGTPRARVNGIAFAAGWIGGLLVVMALVLLVFGDAEPGSSSSDTANWVKLILGVVLILMAGRQWRSRPRPGEEPVMPKWMATIDAFPPGRALVAGAVLSGVNPKNLALTLAAAASIAQAGLSGGDEAIVVLVFVVIASLTVAGPVVAYLVAGQRAERALASLKEFMAAHNTVIMMVVLLIIGAKLVGNGLAGINN